MLRPAPATETGETGAEEEQAQEPGISLEDIQGIDQNKIANFAKARKAIKSIQEENGGQELPREAQDIIANHYLGRDNLGAIDKSTQDLFDIYEDKLEDEQKTWFGISKNKIKKFGSKVLSVLESASASVIGRAVFKLSSHTAPVAGTLTGLVVGGIFGWYRAKNAEENRQYGSQGIIDEYQAIKNNEVNPNRQAEAMTFLHKVIEKKDIFRGSTDDLLELLVFYKKEAGSNIKASVVEQVIAELWEQDDSKNASVNQFKDSAKEACWEAAKKGAWKGALFGAGMGLASDLVTWGVHAWRFAHYRHEFIHDHYGAQNEFHPHYDNNTGSAPDIAPDPHFNALNNNTGLNLPATPYGNALSNAIEGGVKTGQLHVPTAYMDQMLKEGFTEQEAVKQFAYNFNFTQVPHIGDGWNMGQQIDLNMDGVKDIMHNMIQGGHMDTPHNVWVGGQVDYQQFANTLSTGGDYLYNQFPTQMNILQHHDGELWKKALEYAVGHSKESIAEGMLHGAVIGTAVGIYNEKQASKIENSGKDIKAEETPVTPGGGAGATGTTEETPAAGTPEAAAAAAEAAAVVVPETATAEEAVPAEPAEQVDWELLLYGDYERFTVVANDLLKEFRDKAWANIDSDTKPRIISLINTINQYNAKGLRFKIALQDSYVGTATKYNVSAPLADDSTGLTVTNIETGEAGFLGFTTVGAKFNLSLMERKPDVSENIPATKIGTYHGHFDYGYLAEIVGAHRRDGKDATILIVNNRKLFPEDKGKSQEILKFDPDAKEITVRLATGNIRKIKEEKFNLIDSYEVYEWNRIGDNSEYKNL